MKNSIFVIKPYKWEGLWVFDDPAVGLVKEPFVGGADTIIDVATSRIPKARRGLPGRLLGRLLPRRPNRAGVGP